MENYQILIIEDESEISQSMQRYLSKRCIHSHIAPTAKLAMRYLENNPVDLVVLDLCLPDVYGIDICRMIRSTYNFPIIIVSAESGDDIRISGLQAGADDYLEKPYNSHELYLKITHMLSLYKHRNAKQNTDVKLPTQVGFSGWSYHLAEKQLVDSYGVEVILTSTEHELLQLMVLNEGKLLTRDIIAQEVSSISKEGTGRSIDVHINRIREKIGNANLVKSVRSHGYIFVGKTELVH